MKDLFGVEVPDVDPPPRTDWAHPAKPGTGPEGKTCKTCDHLRVNAMSKNYYKCGLIKATGGPGTDIHLKDAACAYYDKGDK